MFRMSDDFFIGLGCTPMTDKFWDKSVLKRADGGDQMVCHASAWDFMDGNTTYNGKDELGMWEDGETGDYRYELMLVTDVGDKILPNLGVPILSRNFLRVKQCTVKTQKQFVTVHHEMGHIQYYQQYAHQEGF